jgi:hypothetical protein
MTAELDHGCDLPTIEPSAGFARGVMERIAEAEALRTQAAAQSRALGVVWVSAAFAGVLGALSIGSALSGPLPSLAGLGEVVSTILSVSGAGDWLPVALIAASLGLAGAAIGQTVARRPAGVEGRA